MVAVTQDLRWPFIGDSVTLEASSLSGDQARFQLTARPSASKIDLYDAGKLNYLQSAGDRRCTIKPDADGYYTIRCIDENVTVNAPHYSNDGGVGQSVGIATATVVASASYTLYVGRVCRRSIGFAPNNVELQVHAHSSSSTHGVLTYKSGTAYAPTLKGATTDRARLAIRGTAVVSAVGAIGGSSYAGSSALIGWDNVISTSESTKLGWTLTKLNFHVCESLLYVHNLANAVGDITEADATNLASLITLTNDIKNKYIAHRADDALQHQCADSINYALLADLTAGTTTAGCVLTHLASRNIFEGHIKTVVNDLSNFDSTLGRPTSLSLVHYPPGDWLSRLTVRISVGATLASAIAATNNMSAKYTQHHEYCAAAPLKAPYHSTIAYDGVATSSLRLAAGIPINAMQYVETINNALNCWQAHVTNTVYANGASATFHTAQDYSSRVDTLPRAASEDLQSAVALREILDHMIDRHVKIGSATIFHTIAIASSSLWNNVPTGAEKIAVRYYDASSDQSGVVPLNENEAAAKLTMIAGWEKV